MIETSVGIIDDSQATPAWSQLSDEQRDGVVGVLVAMQESVPRIREWLANMVNIGWRQQGIDGDAAILSGAGVVRDVILERYAIIRDGLAQRYGIRWHRVEDAA